MSEEHAVEPIVPNNGNMAAGWLQIGKERACAPPDIDQCFSAGDRIMRMRLAQLQSELFLFLAFVIAEIEFHEPWVRLDVQTQFLCQGTRRFHCPRQGT